MVTADAIFMVTCLECYLMIYWSGFAEAGMRTDAGLGALAVTLAAGGLAACSGSADPAAPRPAASAGEPDRRPGLL